jgi:hypothetical protein
VTECYGLQSKFPCQKIFVLTEQQVDNGGDRSMNNLNILIIQNYINFKNQKEHIGLTLLFYLHNTANLFFVFLKDCTGMSSRHLY